MSDMFASGHDNIVVAFTSATEMTKAIAEGEKLAFRPAQMFVVDKEVWCVFFKSPAHEDLAATGDAIEELRKKLDLPEDFE